MENQKSPFKNIENSLSRGEEYPSLEEFLFTQSGNIDIGYQVNSSMQFSYGPEYLAFEICYQIEKQYWQGVLDEFVAKEMLGLIRNAKFPATAEINLPLPPGQVRISYISFPHM